MTDESATATPPPAAEPGQLVRPGHPAGDFLEAWAWELLEERDGFLKVLAHLPDRVRNPRGQLFGGFTPAYVDLIALATAHRRSRSGAPAERRWLATASMNVDYFKPILGPKFIMESRHETQNGRTHFVLTSFLQDGEVAVTCPTGRLASVSRRSPVRGRLRRGAGPGCTVAATCRVASAGTWSRGGSGRR